MSEKEPPSILIIIMLSSGIFLAIIKEGLHPSDNIFSIIIGCVFLIFGIVGWIYKAFFLRIPVITEEAFKNEKSNKIINIIVMIIGIVFIIWGLCNIITGVK